MSTKFWHRLSFSLATVALLPSLAACGGSFANATPPSSTVTINPGFQSSLSPLPTVPTYRCGAWSSSNAPGSGSIIAIYARLTTGDAKGISGATATATVHFHYGDTNLGQTTSDTGGYVTFTLALRGQQPAKVPATVDVTFSGLPHGETVNCTPAFFTPI